jgi:hypothetical protein
MSTREAVGERIGAAWGGESRATNRVVRQWVRRRRHGRHGEERKEEVGLSVASGCLKSQVNLADVECS